MFKKNILLISAFLFLPNIFSQETINVVFPDDFQNEADYMRFEGKTLNFDQTLTVTNNSSWQRYGELTLSSLMLTLPVDAALPNSTEYHALIERNAKNRIILDDGSTAQYPYPLPFADAHGTRRTGSRVNNLKATLHKVGGRWTLYPVAANPPVFYGNERPLTPTVAQNYNVKVCGFNLEYYIATDFDEYGNFGPANETMAARQHSKILKAIRAIDADIYGFVEIQTGQPAIRKICRELNLAAGDSVYSCINDGTSVNGTYTKVGYLYNRKKIAPVGGIKSINIGVKERKKTQGFMLLENNEKFIFSLNHFKAKSGYGSGENADQNDGQGAFNADRKAEATAVVNNINSSYKAFYNDEDVLIMGDLNAYRQEEPLHIFYENGYINLLSHFQGDTAYSYLYDGQIGCLDHALANVSMAQQTVSASVFHINADEPNMFEYGKNTWQDNMYRSSDHDAVVVALNLGTYNSVYNSQNSSLEVIADKSSVTILNAEKQWVTITDINGKQILHKFIKEKETVLSKNQLGISNGVYIFFFDDMRASKLKYKKIVL
jgi:predicted extracellular nuclease